MCQTYCSNDFKIRQQVTTTKKSHLLKVTFTFSNSKSNPRSLKKNQKDRKLVTEAFTHPFTKPKFDSNFILHICINSFLTKIISRIQLLPNFHLTLSHKVFLISLNILHKWF